MALEVGRSIGRSTVDSGAATMKMMSSTRMTSMNGVTLISCVSPKSSSSSTSVNVTPIHYSATCALLRGAPDRSRTHTVEVARQLPTGRSGRTVDQLEIAFRDAREVIVEHDRWNCCEQTDCCCEQRLGDAGRDDRQVGRLRFRNANEAVHDAPDGAEQSDERRSCTNRREHAHAHADAARLRARDLGEARRRALLDAGLVVDVRREPRFVDRRADESTHDALVA